MLYDGVYNDEWEKIVKEVVVKDSFLDKYLTAWTTGWLKNASI